MSKLIAFDDYILERLNHYNSPQNMADLPSGIKCPNCGKELRIDKSMVLTSSPPKHRVWCSAEASSCTFNGFVPS